MDLPKILKIKNNRLQLRVKNNWINWNPYTSKLAAYILGNGKFWPFTDKKIVLYLGAAEGNTVSFLSHICHQGRVIAVDISSVSMAELLKVVEERKNIIPCLEDAHFPNRYKLQANIPDIIYQDIAQGDQIEIFIRNYEYFRPKCGFLMLKTGSMHGKKMDILEEVKYTLKENFKQVHIVDISNWAKGHNAYFVE
mgnify:FL=1